MHSNPNREGSAKDAKNKKVAKQSILETIKTTKSKINLPPYCFPCILLRLSFHLNRRRFI